MKIAHLSDIHICSKYKNENIVKINKLINHALDKGVDHFVFTGDISDNAQEKDFLILRKILETYKLLDTNKTSIIIGNHDIFGGVQTPRDLFNFPAKCANTNYKEKVEKFFGCFEELFENVFFATDENPFPFVKKLGDIILIGMNSIDKYSKLKNPFASNGHVSKSQRRQVQQILEQEQFADKIKIIMIHHHFYKNNTPAKSSESYIWNKVENFTMKLRNKKKLFNLFKINNVKLVLHGHSHEMKEYDRKGIKFLNAGGSVENETPDEAGLNIIEIEGNELKINVDLLKDTSSEPQVNNPEELLIPSFAVN